MLVNEGLVLYLVDDLKRKYPLSEMVVGLLGMAFKADCDDTRSSLSYKLKKLLKLVTADVLTTDPHVTTDPELLPVETVIERSDLLILCTPHADYRELDTRNKPVIDVWGYWRHRSQEVVASTQGEKARGEGRRVMSPPLRVAVIGVGFGQQVHVPAFRADSRCEVTTLCASNEAKAAEIAGRLNVPHASGDWRAVVSDPEIDAVSIAVPPRLQPQIALEALEHGKSVFCEKPLGVHLHDIMPLRRARTFLARRDSAPQETRSLPAWRGIGMVNFELCECDAWQKFHQMTTAYQQGRGTSVEINWRVQTYSNKRRIDNWKSRPEEGGGALQGFAAHSFYLLEQLYGPICRLKAQLTKAPTTPATARRMLIWNSSSSLAGVEAFTSRPTHRPRIAIKLTS